MGFWSSVSRSSESVKPRQEGMGTSDLEPVLWDEPLPCGFTLTLSPDRQGQNSVKFVGRLVSVHGGLSSLLGGVEKTHVWRGVLSIPS